MNRRKRVALLLQMSQNFDQGILRGIMSYAQAKGDWAVYVEEHRDLWLPRITGWDGLIVNFHDPDFAGAVRHARIPLVAIAGSAQCAHLPSPGRHIPLVMPDNAAAGRIAAEHLLSLGLKHLAFCGYLPGPVTDWSVERQEAFHQTVERAGLTPCRPFLRTQSLDSQIMKLQAALVRWLAGLPKPVGILACYDWHARRVLEACAAAGLRVPDDVALVGVDNDTLICELSGTPLSSIEQGRLGIGETAAILLDRWMEGARPEKPMHVVPPAGLVVRQSTRLVAVDDALAAAALRMIHDGACAGLQAAEVARKLGVSRSTLDNRLKAAVGRTADFEIRRTRLEKAKELLARTRLPLQEVAARCGYGTEQYLSTVVREACGVSPGKYRHDHQGASQPG